MKSTSLALATALVCALSLLCAGTSAAARTATIATTAARAPSYTARFTASLPRGELTASEYSQLEHVKTAVGQALSTKPPGWKAALADCTSVSGTPLLAAESSACSVAVHETYAILATVEAVDNLKKCEAKYHANTLRCLLPVYKSLAKWTTDDASAEGALNDALRARGISSECVAVIGVEPAELDNEKHLAGVIEEAVRAMTKLEGEALERLGPEVTKAMEAVLDYKAPTDIAVCKHR